MWLLFAFLVVVPSCLGSKHRHLLTASSSFPSATFGCSLLQYICSCAYMLMDTTLQSSLKVLICFCLFFFHVEAKTKKVKRKKKQRGEGRPWISSLYWLDQYDKVTVYEKLSSDQFKRSTRAKTWLGVAVEVRGCDWSIPQRWRSAELHVAVEVTRSFNPPGGESPLVTLGFLIIIPLKCFEY